MFLSVSTLNVDTSIFYNNVGLKSGMIRAYNSQVRFNTTRFLNNRAIQGSGGAGYYRECSLYVADCYFEGNSAVMGGALDISAGPYIIERTTFVSNRIAGKEISDDDNGGAISVMDYDTVVGSIVDCWIRDCYFYNNTARLSAGALLLHNVEQTYVYNCTFRANNATEGGAVQIMFSTVYVNNSLFDSNIASFGGAIKIQESNPIITNTVFTRNVAVDTGPKVEVNNRMLPQHMNYKDGYGGAIAVSDKLHKPAIIINSTFLHNSAVFGGAVKILAEANGEVYNSYFENNTALSGAGTSGDDGSRLISVNNTFRRNRSFNQGGAQFFNEGVFVTYANTYIENDAPTGTLFFHHYERNGTHYGITAAQWSGIVCSGCFFSGNGNSSHYENHNVVGLPDGYRYITVPTPVVNKYPSPINFKLQILDTFSNTINISNFDLTIVVKLIPETSWAQYQTYLDTFDLPTLPDEGQIAYLQQQFDDATNVLDFSMQVVGAAGVSYLLLVRTALGSSEADDSYSFFHHTHPVAFAACVGDEINAEFTFFGRTWPSCRLPNYVSFSVSQVLQGVNVVMGLLTLVSCITIIIHRKKEAIKASAVIFMIAMGVGCLLANIAVAMFLLDPITDAACAALPWVTHTAFVLLFGSLFVKTYRVMEIFNVGKTLAIVRINDRQLMSMLGVMMGIVWVTLIVWSSSARATMVVQLVQYDAYITCSTPKWWIFGPILAEAAFLLYGVYLSIRIRELPSVFNESKYIAASLYNVCFFGSLVIIVSVFVLNDPYSKRAFVSIGILFCASMTFYLLTVPKFIKLVKQMRSSGSFADNNSNLNNNNSNVGANSKNSRAKNSMPNAQGSKNSGMTPKLPGNGILEGPMRTTKVAPSPMLPQKPLGNGKAITYMVQGQESAVRVSR